MSPLSDSRRLKTTTVFQRVILIGSLPMFGLSLATVPASFWAKGAYFLQQGDAVRYWLNRGMAVATVFFILAAIGVIIHLLTRTVTVTPDGVEIGGMFRSSVRWEEITRAAFEQGKYTADLVLFSNSGRRYEIGIGNRETAVICQAILTAVSGGNPPK
jgi:hypothetical protein